MDVEAVSKLEERIKEMERDYVEMNPQNPERSKLKEEIVSSEIKLRQMKSQINTQCAASGLPPPYENIYERVTAEYEDDDETVNTCFYEEPQEGDDGCSVM